MLKTQEREMEIYAQGASSFRDQKPKALIICVPDNVTSGTHHPNVRSNHAGPTSGSIDASRNM